MGAIFNSSKHHLAPPLLHKNIVQMHHVNLASWWVQRKRHIGRCLCGGDEDDENQCDASMMHHALNSLIIKIR